MVRVRLVVPVAWVRPVVRQAMRARGSRMLAMVMVSPGKRPVVMVADSPAAPPRLLPDSLRGRA